MLILYIGLTFLVLTFSSYALAYQINGINRIVVGTPISIFESCILQNPDSEEPTVFFTKELVNAKLNEYYTYELRKFTDKYTYDVYYFNQEDHSMCIGETCGAVEISFEATLVYNYHYERTLVYQVQNNAYGS